MSEDYRIISRARGEPRSRGDVGVRVRVQLSGRPSRRWVHDLCARLTTELIGHPGAAHLRMNVNELVQGDEIVLEGVEDREAPALADALQRAVDAANRVAPDDAGRALNVTRRDADAVASHIPFSDPEHAAGTGADKDPPCPRCGEAVPVTIGDREAGDQIVPAEMQCPACGTRLVRDIQGPADHGWRPAE